MDSDLLKNFKFTIDVDGLDALTDTVKLPEVGEDGSFSVQMRRIGGESIDFGGWFKEAMEISPKDQLINVSHMDEAGNVMCESKGLAELERNEDGLLVMKVTMVCEDCLEPLSAALWTKHPVDLFESDGCALMYWCPLGKIPIIPRPSDYVELDIDFGTRWKVLGMEDNIVSLQLPGDETEIKACKCRVIGLWRPLSKLMLGDIDV